MTITLDAIQRKAMRMIETETVVHSHTVAAVLHEINKKHPGLMVIRSIVSGGMLAALTAAGRAVLSGKPLNGRTVPDAERQARHKANLLKKGGKRISVNLRPETMGYVVAIQKHHPEAAISEIVADGIALLAAKVHRAAKEKRT